MTSVGSILAGAFGLVRRDPLSVLAWGLLYVAAIIALLFAMLPFFQVYADLIGQQLAAGGRSPLDPQDLQPYMGRLQSAGGIVFLAEIAVFALVMVIFTATQRAVLRPAQRGIFYLRLGGDELRMMALGMFLTVCISIGMFVAVLALMIVFGIIFALVMASGASPMIGALVFLVAYLILMGAMIYVHVRLSLAFPLTFLRGDFIVGEAWRLTRGRFWTLFGAYFVIGLVYMLLASILTLFAFAPFLSELMQGTSTPEAFQLAFQHQMERFATIDAANVGLGLGAVLLFGLTIALFGGAMATAARDLVPEVPGTAG